MNLTNEKITKRMKAEQPKRVKAAISEYNGGTAFHKFSCKGLEICFACHEALRAVDMIFDEHPEARALVTILRAKSRKGE